MSCRDFRRIAKMAEKLSLPNLAPVSIGTREMVVGSWVSQSDRRRFNKPRHVASRCGFTCVGSMSMLAALSMLGACAPKQLNAGEWQCSASAGGGSGGSGGASQSPSATDPVPVPWSDGFEDGFCRYLGEDGPGYCYGDAPYTLVTEPHNSGRYAAEFKVIGDGQNQTRCVRQGDLPLSAVYGAWYFIPQALKPHDTDNKPVWNLFHFQGKDAPDPRLWDVSLAQGMMGTDDWKLIVWDPVVGNSYSGADSGAGSAADQITIPIGSWFHIELFLKRASDSTGEIALYQDGVMLFDHKNLKSDASKFLQWYVGDFADGVTPADSSLYVDDVSITAMPSSTSATQ